MEELEVKSLKLNAEDYKTCLSCGKEYKGDAIYCNECLAQRKARKKLPKTRTDRIDDFIQTLMCIIAIIGI